MTDDSDSVKIGRIDQKVISLEQWTKDHATDDNTRFERTFGYVKDSFGKMEDRFDKIDTKLDTIWDERNQNKGAFKASKLAGMGIWAAIVMAANYFINGVNHK